MHTPRLASSLQKAMFIMAISIVATACNTIEGVGEDIERAGDEIGEATST